MSNWSKISTRTSYTANSENAVPDWSAWIFGESARLCQRAQLVSAAGKRFSRSFADFHTFGGLFWLTRKKHESMLWSVLPARLSVWCVENFNVEILSDTTNMIMLLSKFAWWYCSLSFTCSYYFQRTWSYFVTAVSNSFKWRFHVLSWVILLVGVLIMYGLCP